MFIATDKIDFISIDFWLIRVFTQPATKAVKVSPIGVAPVTTRSRNSGVKDESITPA